MAWVRALRRELDAETVVCREREREPREKHQPKPTSRFVFFHGNKLLQVG